METIEEKIKNALDEIRGMLQADGGDLELVAIADKTVKLKLRGACGCCPHAALTIKQGIERFLREKVEEGITVEQVR